jgi:hypothetical protein
MINFGSEFFSNLNAIDSLVNDGTGRNYGIELTLEHFLDPISGYYFLVTTSVFSSKYRGFDDIERNTAFNGNFVFNILGGKEFTIRKNNFLSFDLKLVWAGGNRYIPYNIEQTNSSFYIKVFDWENAYIKKKNDYFRVNFRTSYKFNSKKFNMELAIDILNLTNHKNIFWEGFNPVTGEIEKTYQFSILPLALWRILF